jgi:hypothetical protein
MKPRHGILDEDGNVVECDLMTWALWFERSRQRIIEQDEIEGFWVSTIFMGLDHQYLPKGRPLWFETMVFHAPEYDPEHDRMRRQEAGYCERYSTLKEARRGHLAAVEWLRQHQFTKESRADPGAVLAQLRNAKAR